MFVNCMRLKIETAKWSRWNTSSCQVKQICYLFWGYVSCKITAFSLTALMSSCRNVSFFPQCKLILYRHCFTPVRDAQGFDVLLGLCDLRTATQLSDDKSCHLCKIIRGRMRTLTCSWSHRQTKRCGWGWKGWKWRKEFHPVWCVQTPLKSFLLFIPKQNKVSSCKGKRSPMSPSSQQEKGWMNLKQTSERLSVSQTVQQRNHLPRACRTDRMTWVWVIDLWW